MNKSNSTFFSLPFPVALIGMMGAGKTSIGQALSQLLSVPFFDSDAEIEAAAGRTVPEIFASYGEAEFRRLERRVVSRLLNGPACLLSLGGGAFMAPDTRQELKNKAFSVWIKVEHPLLLSRVLRQGHRPLLNTEKPEEKLTALLSEREPVYALADLTVACDDRPVEENARQIIAALQALPEFRTA